MAQVVDAGVTVSVRARDAKTNLGINVAEGIDKAGVLLFHVYR
jgi:hypothetical protein